MIACSDYLNNRHYDPSTGVFVSVDPLVTMTGQPYIYGAANPVTFSDPSGLCIEPGSFSIAEDGTYTYTQMGGPECYDSTEDGHGNKGMGLDGGYGIASVPGPVTTAGTGFKGLPPTVGSVLKVAGLVYGSAAAGVALTSGAASVARAPSALCLRVAFWCTKLAPRGAALGGAGNELANGAPTGPTGGGRFIDGDIFVTSVKSRAGAVTVMAETGINGRALALTDLAIYADDGTLINQVGAAQFLALRNTIAAEAASMGFDTLHVTGVRVANSSSANPG